MNPLVSIILPTYNRAKYLGEAIESALKQTYSHFELIIIDDGSTDNTAQLLATIADERIQCIRFKQNKGVIAARNAGLDIAKGKYIAFMDSDDISLPHRLAAQVAILEEFPNLGVCSAWVEFFEKRTGVWAFKGGQEIMVRSLFDIPVHFNCAMVRRSIVEQYNIRFVAEFLPPEDYLFLLEIVRRTGAYIIPQVLCKYRWHDSNISIELEPKNRINGAKISALAFKILLNKTLVKEQHQLLYDLYHNRLSKEQLSIAPLLVNDFVEDLKQEQVKDAAYISCLKNVLNRQLFNCYYVKSSRGLLTFKAFLKSKVWRHLPLSQYYMRYIKLLIKSFLKK